MSRGVLRRRRMPGAPERGTIAPLALTAVLLLFAVLAFSVDQGIEMCIRDRRDCGDDPSYCMSERARTLTGMAGADNPRYASVDAWSFSVALDRARAYYARRLAVELSLIHI